MPLLTAEQLEQLRQIIRDASTAVAISTTGMEVSDEQMQRLVDGGYVDPAELHNVVLDSFELGRIMVALDAAKGWSYPELKSHLANNPVELSARERLAVDHLQARAGQFCVGLGTRAEGDLTLSAADMDQALAEAFRFNIQNEAAQSLARRETIGRLTTRLRQMSQDWARDWGRIASTESHMAHQVGYVEATAERHGSGVMMAKVPENSACPDCLRLYLDADGKPRVEPLDWWTANGVANYGRKRADWLAVLGAAHPWCFAGGQPVITSRGDTSIEDVRVGDAVLSAEGRWRPVVQVHKRFYQGPAFEFFWGDKSLTCTPNHPLGDGAGNWHAANVIAERGDLVEVDRSKADNPPPVGRSSRELATILLLFSPSGVPVSAVNFNGNLALPFDEIKEEPSDHLVELERDSASGKKELGKDFVGGHGPADLSALSGLDKFVRLLGPANRFVGSGGQRFSFFGGESLHADMLRFARCSNSDPRLLESLDDGATAHPQLGGYRLYGQLVLDIQSADIVDVEGESPGAKLLSVSGGESGKPNVFAFLGASKGDSRFSESLPDRGASQPGDICNLPNGKPLINIEANGLRDVHGGLQYHRRGVTVKKTGLRGYVYNLSVDQDESFHVQGVPSKNCQCYATRVPKGWGFDDGWNLVPLADEEGEGQEDDETEKSRRTLTVQTLRKSRRLHGKMRWKGLEISIENRKGSVRKWYDPHTKTEGQTEMSWPYGYLNLTEGADGDHVDCFVGPDLETATHVHVVHQMKAPHFDRYDEDKVMIGWGTPKAAKAAYLAHFDQPGFFGSMDAIPVDRFVQRVKERKLDDGRRIQKGRGIVVKSTAQFRGSHGYAGHSRPVGTMGNVGQPARTPGENTFAAQAPTDHPYGPDARKKKRKKKRKKQDRSKEKERISISPVSYVDGYVRDKPKVDALPEPDTERNRAWIDGERERNAARLKGVRLTIRPQEVRS